MKKVFENYQNAIMWIAQNALTQSHLDALKDELSKNHLSTGSFFVYTIILD
jgi:hypothetical protein